MSDFNDDLTSIRRKHFGDGALFGPYGREYIEECFRNPLVVRRIERIIRNRDESPSDYYLSTPSDAVAEKKIVTMGLLAGHAEYTQNIQDAITSRENLKTLSFLLASNIEDSRLFFWHRRTMEAVREMTDVPDHVLSKEGCSYPRMCWMFGAPAGVRRMGDEELFDLRMLQIAQKDDHLQLWMIVCPYGKCRDGSSDYLVSVESLEFGKVISQTYLNGAPSFVGLIIRSIAFLNSKYIDHSPQRLCRTDRKLLIHAGMSEEAEQGVHVVELRAKEQDVQSPEEPGERDWSGRWWVRGHFRRQPVKGGHKLIWIAPFIKGPEDKPFIEKVYHVVR